MTKPWKETQNRFLPSTSKYKNGASLKTNAEREFIEGMCADMGITDAFILASEMVPIPLSNDELEPLAYNAWTDLHKQTMDWEPNRTVGWYVGISSAAASDAITARLNSSSSRHQWEMSSDYFRKYCEKVSNKPNTCRFPHAAPHAQQRPHSKAQRGQLGQLAGILNGWVVWLSRAPCALPVSPWDCPCLGSVSLAG